MKRASYLLLTVLVLTLSVFPQEGSSPKLIEEYDRFADSTWITIGKYPGLALVDAETATRGYTNAWLYVSLIYHGKNPQAGSANISLTLIGRNGMWPSLESPELRFIIDGDRVNFGPMRYVATDGEIYSILVTAEQFRKLARGKSVEGQLFTTEFKLTEDQLALLRDLAKRMEP